MYSDISVWLGIVLGGIAGCVATAIFANLLRGVPISAVAGNPWKHLWSIIFAIPIPLLLAFDPQSGVFIAFLWLMLVPTIASKVYFGPKEVPAIILNAFHTGYAIAALVVYILVTRTLMVAAG